jgi:hypothetical protein
MTRKISKTNDMTYLKARLDEVRMSGYDRIRAEAQLARAEAVADAVADLFAWVKRVLTTRKPANFRRTSTSAG